MFTATNRRRAGALFILVTGAVLAWAGDHYDLNGGLGAIIAVWLIGFGATACFAALQKHPWRLATGIAFLLTFVFVAVALFREAAEPAEGYAGNCTVLVHAVAATGVVPVSIAEPPRLAVACSTAQHGVLLRQFNQIDVWGVVDDHQQRAVLSALQRVRSAGRSAPVHVRFWEKENWGKCPPPSRPQARCRGPEMIVRTAVVN
jgi:hypothetical protein